MNLKNEWKNLCDYIGIKNPVAVEKWWTRLATLYSEENRFYHNLEHIAACLQECEFAQKEIYHPMDIKLAIWFHDAIYDTQRNDNEENSVLLFIEAAKELGLSQYTVNPVKTMILATKHVKTYSVNSSSQNNDLCLFLDIDLSILGKNKEIFTKYDKDIRQEYSWVPEAAYTVARKDILEGFLSRERIFISDIFARKYEFLARKNIENLLNSQK